MKNYNNLSFTLLAAIVFSLFIESKAFQPTPESLSENTETVVLVQPDQKELDDNILAQEQLDTQPLVENIPQVPQESSWSSTKKKLINAARITKNIAIDASVACTIEAIEGLVHELGHAVTAKILLGCPIDIVLGGKEKVLFTIGGIKFGNQPLIGDQYAQLSATLTPSNMAKLALVNLAGPTASIIYRYCIKRILDKQHGKLPVSKFVNFSFFWIGIYANLLPGNLPFSSTNNDASQCLTCITWLIKHYRGK